MGNEIAMLRTISALYRQHVSWTFSRRSKRIPLVFATSLTLAVWTGPMAEESTRIGSFISQVSADSIRSHIQRLQNFGTRYALTDSCRAAERYLYRYFENCGVDSVWYDTVSHKGISLRNVASIIRGNVDSDAYIVVCAHIDAMSETPLLCAPGAEDNASGVSVIMELARIFGQAELAYSIMLVGFTGEEIGLVGSKQFAEAMKAKKERICALLNIDMVGWPGGAFGIKILCDSSTLHLAEIEKDAATQYSDMEPEIVVRPPLPSDNYYFQTAGYPCLAHIERFETDTSGYKWYHSCADTLGNLSLSLIGEVSKTVIATVLEISKIPAPPAHLQSKKFITGDSVTYSWAKNKEADILCYKAFWGQESRRYQDSALIYGDSITLYSGKTGSTHFAVKALDSDGNSSWYSSETESKGDAHAKKHVNSLQFPSPISIYETPAGIGVAYRLSAAQSVKLQIYDTNGRVLKVLWDGYQRAGAHSSFWNRRSDYGTFCANGLYIFALSSGSISQSVQFILK